MVLVNTQKFACKSCIQGHRSSSCGHTDRPLFEVKKKGRPISQCDMCRELRHSRRIHSKYQCTHGKGEEGANSQASSSSSASKARRFVPITPTLPNGLKDVLSSSHAVQADPRQPGETTLHRHSCGSSSRRKGKCSDTSASTSCLDGEDGLSVLARAATFYLGTERRKSPLGPQNTPTSQLVQAPPEPKFKRPGSPTEPCCHKHKRLPAHPSPSEISFDVTLPPLLLGSSSANDHIKFPAFPIMPPISVITSLASSGCTCGLRCGCPGCIQHRGAAYASKDHKDCADGCGTCIDHEGGIELPSQPSGSTKLAGDFSSSVLDRFFSRAAALPQPPVGRKKVGPWLDPTDLAVYSRETRTRGGHPARLPKLKCCSGRCGCPGGRCVCEETCDGDCVGGGDEVVSMSYGGTASGEIAQPVRACCGRR